MRLPCSLDFAPSATRLAENSLKPSPSTMLNGLPATAKTVDTISQLKLNYNLACWINKTYTISYLLYRSATVVMLINTVPAVESQLRHRYRRPPFKQFPLPR